MTLKFAWYENGMENGMAKSLKNLYYLSFGMNGRFSLSVTLSIVGNYTNLSF